jgi:hypothetical protein
MPTSAFTAKAKSEFRGHPTKFLSDFDSVQVLSRVFPVFSWIPGNKLAVKKIFMSNIYQRIRTIPLKRTEHKAIDYLEEQEMQTLLDTVKGNSRTGICAGEPGGGTGDGPS